MTSTQFTIEGMHCAGCVAGVTRAIRNAGATPEEVTVGHARIQYDPTRLSPHHLLLALEKAGFTARIDQPSPHASSEIGGAQ
jgi:copper chaperone CopZ